MVAADVHDSRQRLSGFQPHVDLMHAFIADWSDDDNVLGCGNGDDSMLARRISPREIGTPRDAERGAMVQLLASPLLPRTPVAVHTVNSPVSDADASTSTASTPSSPESDYGATAPHTLSPAVEAPPTAATIPPTAAASKGDKAVVPRRKRTLPKVEIAQLREQSRALEAQLLELREYWKSAPARIRKSSSAGTGSKSLSVIDEPIWQHAANQQRDMLSVSEAKNLALRAKYELNRKIVRALRKVLMKRRTSPATFDSALYLMPLRNPQQVFAESYSDFKTLLCDIKPMYADTARIEQLIASRLQRLDPQSLAFREWRLQNEHSASRGDTYIEAVDCYALPFDHMHVAAAMRHQHDALSSGNTNKRFCEFFERCDHSAMRQAIYAYKHPNQQGYVRNKDVTHFFHSATHSIIVSVTLIEPVTASGTPIAGIVLRERKWTIVRNEDDVGGGVGGDGATSLVCSYHKITCDRVAKEFEAHWTPAALIDAMAPAWSSTLTKARCELESRLIELSMDSRL